MLKRLGGSGVPILIAKILLFKGSNLKEHFSPVF
jgi:hypothetical protein